MKRLTLFFILVLPCLFALAQSKREIRAVWVTTNWGLDWPANKTAAGQQREFQNLLNKLETIHINTIIFQVQCRSDVFWDSEYQPWSRYLTNTPGKDPGYDVMQFVIDECRKRGMEIHAWVVPYPLGNDTTVEYYGEEHVTNTHPELCVKHGADYYLNPGLPGTREYLLNLYGELIDKYDFDGINLDYTRYPDNNFPDANEFELYGGNMSRADWRRDNINQFVHALYDMMKEKKPDMKLGAAPIGAYEALPDASAGWYGYSAVFQDPVQWMESEKLDLNIPQVYWTANYEPHLKNWIKKSNGRHTVAGLAAYKMLASEGNWTAETIINQIDQARSWGADGICFFRTAQITTNTKKILDLLQADQFKYPAHIPAMDWYGATQPNNPTNLKVENSESGAESFTYTLNWEKSEGEESNSIKYYSVYVSTSEEIDFEDPTNIAIRSVNGNSIEYKVPDPSKDYYVAITAFDKDYNESDPSNIIKIAGDPALNIGQTTISLDILQTTETVLIKAQTPINGVELYSINGTMVRYENSNGNEISLNIASLDRGIYIMIVELANGEVIKQKLVK